MGISSATFTYLAQLVRDHSAIVLDETKGYLLESRLTPLLYAEGIKSMEELAFLLRRDSFSALHRKVLDAMTNNETWFFRDVSPFEALKKAVLPELITRREGERSLSIWSAACSSGQEIYSIAMLIREHFPLLLNWRLNLLGTDISDAILTRARAGDYSQLEINRGLPAPLLAKYFERSGLRWRLSPRIREMASFRSMNLSTTWPLIGSFDVVFLRNVLIYFSLETRKEILRQMRAVIRPGGYLFLGSAETTLNLDDSYERVGFENSFYHRPKS